MRKGFNRIFFGLFILVGLSPAFANELLEEHSENPIQAEARMEALEPWETPLSGFFIRSHHGVPDIDDSRWILHVDGLVEKSMTFTLKELQSMSKKSIHAVLECSGNWRAQQKPEAPGVQWKKGAVGNAQWDGIPVLEILKKVKPKPNARFARVEGADLPALPSTPPFIRSVPLHKLEDPNSLIALKMNRVQIPILHGGPLRLILPGWYGENWTKWITHMTFTEVEDSGFYMKKAYRIPKTRVNPGEPWDSSTGAALEEIPIQSIITSPIAGQTLSQGTVSVRGKAFSDQTAISQVDLSIDGGSSWIPTVVSPTHPTGGWQEFTGTLEIKSTGPLKILSRATDIKGNQQPLEPAWNPGGYARNAVDSVSIFVAERGLPVGHVVLENKCLICHSRGIIESQRLTFPQWEGEIKKMESFGVQLSSQEREALLSYLVNNSPSKSPTASQPVAYESRYRFYDRTESLGGGNPVRGQKLFVNHCAGCHGKFAQGQIGPRLIGRAIPSADFWITVTHGKHLMPAFEKILKKQEIADIQSFLQKNRISH